MKTHTFCGIEKVDPLAKLGKAELCVLNQISNRIF